MRPAFSLAADSAPSLPPALPAVAGVFPRFTYFSAFLVSPFVYTGAIMVCTTYLCVVSIFKWYGPSERDPLFPANALNDQDF